MTAIANLPDIRPSLLLDFANSGRVDPRIQCTRASSATCVGPDGKLRTVGNNVPRIDYDPVTGKCLGLLVEEARTNTGLPLIASGSVPQVPGYTYNADLPALVAGRVALRNYAVGAVDASSSAGERANIRGNPAGLTENTTYTVSIYVCGVKDGATRATMYFNMSGMTALTTTADLVIGAWRRLVLTFTLPSGVSGTGALRVAGAGGADPLQPFGADGYQFEVGSFATSYIPTEASAVTRAAERVEMLLPYSLSTSSDFYLLADSTERNPVLSFFTGLVSLSRIAAQGDYFGLVNPSLVTYKRLQQVIGGSVKLGVNSPALTLGAPVKAGFAVNAARLAMSTDGSISESTTANFDRTQILDVLHIGKFGTSPTVGARVISRIAIGIGDITNAQLQRLTA